MVFADTEGNIGYVMAGVVPIRAKGSGFGPVPGWSGEFEWTAWLTFEDLPQLWNPPSGVIVTANNAVVDRHFAWHLSWDWMNGFRAKRIEQLLSERARFSPEHFRRIQLDVHCIPGPLFASCCANLKPTDKTEIEALGLLLAWDGEASPNSAGAAVYEAFILATIRRALEPELGKELMSDLLGRSSTPIAPMNLMLGRYTGFMIEALLRDDRSMLPAGSPGWQGILAAALGESVKLLKEKLGPDPATWQWGKLHRLRLKHPLGALKPLNLIFDGPDVPVGGDTDTPFQTAFAAHEPFAATAWAPSWRQIVDLSAIGRTVSIYPGGQSGHPRSPHYLDLFPPWYRGDYHPHWIERAEIERHLEGRLILQPLRSR